MKSWLMVLMMIAPLAGAWASEGGTSSGGGNALPGSTAEDVQNAITQVFEKDFKLVLTGLYRLALPSDGKVPEILSKMFAGPDFDHSSIIDDLKKTRVLVRSDGPCLDLDGEPADASESEDVLGMLICFSVPRLMKQSITNLPDQILALTFHEFAHHYGYGESAAVLIQKFIMKQLASACSIEVAIKDDPLSPKVSQILWFLKRHKFNLNRAAEVIYEAKYRYNNAAVRFSAIDPGLKFTSSDDSSQVTFTYLDLGGSLKPGLLTWQHLHDLGDGYYRTVETPALKATIDGSPLEATSVSISRDCFM